MTLKHKELVLVMLLGAFLYTSCVTQKFQEPGMAVSGQLYRDTVVTDSASFATVNFTRLFTDTVLQNLITAGINENLDLKKAMQRMTMAQENVQQAKADFFPSLQGNARANSSKQSIAALNLPPDFIGTFPLAITTFQASISSSWEADIWGKLKSTKRVAVANFLQSDAARRAIQTQLVADIAGYYFQLLSLDEQLRITEQTLINRKKEMETMKVLKEAAIVTGAAVVQSEANRYAAEVLIPDIKRLIRETENALSILIARAPGSINRSSMGEQHFSEDLRTGVPSQLLTNRPDVQQAAFAFRAAFENTNVARTYFYPQLTITAEGGLSTLKIQDFFNRSVFYNIIGGLTQPIFNKRLNKTRLNIAKAQQQEAYYVYQKSLLQAGAEVSNALYAYKAAQEKQYSRAFQLQALEKSVDYTRELLQFSSATNYTDVLTSEQSLLAAQLGSVNDRLQQMQAVVNLYKALGGGWQDGGTESIKE
ncbi:efflux transporter outer membrane subunit [Flavihumibacter fluvii]|uniref:efflux transporter outer membrane subunit n=1 Tax=Flavihumibacter fluvii TaxID=2838157 RepID=UPI001BDEA9FC|nr:efflux transporter outer membrane subunit [Flavihumibacter fluvii]ULQ52010.1 efflux transporter outer membrane subunit [Flavihumibacter fluvii]